jgi:hypothetical protein
MARASAILAVAHRIPRTGKGKGAFRDAAAIELTRRPMA